MHIATLITNVINNNLFLINNYVNLIELSNYNQYNSSMNIYNTNIKNLFL